MTLIAWDMLADAFGKCEVLPRASRRSLAREGLQTTMHFHVDPVTRTGTKSV